MAPRISPRPIISKARRLVLLVCGVSLAAGAADTAPLKANPEPAAKLFPLTSVRLLDGPFAQGVAANRAYVLALDPDRLLAPFLREAGLTPRKPPYDNWESGGLNGHTAGHYLSALAFMSASGADTPEGALPTPLDYNLALSDVFSQGGPVS